MSIKTYPRDIGGYQYIEFDTAEEANRKLKKGSTKMQQQSTISENTDNDKKKFDMSKHLSFVNGTYFISDIRDKLHLHKKTLEKIELRDIIIKQRLCIFKLLNMEEIIRSEVMLQLFKQEDLTIADFPKLREIIIDLKPTSVEFRPKKIKQSELQQQQQPQNQVMINIKGQQSSAQTTAGGKNQQQQQQQQQNQQANSKKGGKDNAPTSNGQKYQGLSQNEEEDDEDEEDIDYVNDSKALMNRNYHDLVNDVQDTLMSHKRLKQYMNETKVTLINYVFTTMETFNYAYKFLDNYYESIEILIFRNIKRLQKDTFIKLGQVISKQKVMNQLVFEYVFLSNYHVEVIRDILGRRRDKWISLSFIQCGLNWIDLRTLFIDNLRLKDLDSLIFLNIKKNPLLLNCPLLNKLNEEMEMRRAKMKKENKVVHPEKDYDGNSQQQKLNTAINALVKTGFSKMMLPDPNNKQQQQQQQICLDMEPKSLVFDNLFSKQNDIGLQTILISYTKCDCCQMLSLKGFDISQTSNTIRDLLIQIICDTKSLIHVNLKKTNIPETFLNKLAQKLKNNNKMLAYLNLSNSKISNWQFFFSKAWPFVSTLILDNCKIDDDNKQNSSINQNNNIKDNNNSNKVESNSLKQQQILIKTNQMLQQIIQGIKIANQKMRYLAPFKLEIFSFSIKNQTDNMKLDVLRNLIKEINICTNLDLLRFNGSIISEQDQQTIKSDIINFNNLHSKDKLDLSNNFLTVGIKDILFQKQKAIVPLQNVEEQTQQININKNDISHNSSIVTLSEIIQQENNQQKNQQLNIQPIFQLLLPKYAMEIQTKTPFDQQQPSQNQQSNNNIDLQPQNQKKIAQLYFGVKYELVDNVELKEQWEFTKPKTFFQLYGISFKAISVGKDKQSNQKHILRSEKFGLDLLYGLRTAMKNWTSDTVTHVLNYLDLSDCTLFSHELISELSRILILEQTQQNQAQQEGDSAAPLKFQDLDEQLLNSFTRVQNLYMDSLKLQDNNIFINLCEINISANGERCKPKTLQYLLEAAIFAAGNNLRQITIGTIEDKYCQAISDGLLSGKEQLKKYFKINYDPEELSLQNIETFPEQLVKNFLTNCGNTPKVLKIKGLGIFQNVRQVFEEFEQKNMKKQVQLESFIFRYSSCFGIGPEENLKLIQTVQGPNVKYIDIHDDQEETTTGQAQDDQNEQKNINIPAQNQKQSQQQQKDQITLELEEDECQKLMNQINKEYKYIINKKVKQKNSINVKKYVLDENQKFNMMEQLKRFRKIFNDLKKKETDIKKISETNNKANAQQTGKNAQNQQQLLDNTNEQQQTQIALTIDCEKFTFPLEIAHAMHSKFQKIDFTSKDVQDKLVPIFQTGPDILFIDFYFLENFLLGTLGIYPSQGHIYSYILKESFFQYLSQIGNRLKARSIKFLPTAIDENMEMLGEGAKDDILKIYSLMRKSLIDQLIFNYSWNSEVPFSQIQERIDPKTRVVIWEPHDEKQLIDMFIRMPPSKFRIKNCSINALKLIYVICHGNPNFQDCEIVYDSVNVVNAGIAYALRDYFRTPEISSQQCACFDCGISIKYYLRKVMCSVFDAIVEDDVNYKYDESVIALDGFLQNNRFSYYIIQLLTIIYYVICCFCPYYFSERDGLISIDKKGRGVSWTSHIIYGIFALVTFLVEMYLYINTLKRIFHLAPPLKMSVGQGFIPRTVNIFKKMVINFRWFSYQYVIFGKALLLSQNQRLDFYSDVSFIIVCLQNEFQDLAFISACILVLTMIHSIHKMAKTLLYKLCCDRAKTKISTHYINEFYESAVNIEFVALGNVLDIMAPYNVSQIPNNCITRLFLPQQAGLSINARMMETSFKIFFEDVPQIIMQILFMLRTSKGDMTIFISFGSSVLSIIAQLVTFLTLRPSIITQMDFQKLSKRKLDQLPKTKQHFLKDSKLMWDEIEISFKKQVQSNIQANPNQQQKLDKDNENDDIEQ